MHPESGFSIASKLLTVNRKNENDDINCQYYIIVNFFLPSSSFPISLDSGQSFMSLSSLDLELTAFTVPELVRYNQQDPHR